MTTVLLPSPDSRQEAEASVAISKKARRSLVLCIARFCHSYGLSADSCDRLQHHITQQHRDLPQTHWLSPLVITQVRKISGEGAARPSPRSPVPRWWQLMARRSWFDPYPYPLAYPLAWPLPVRHKPSVGATNGNVAILRFHRSQPWWRRRLEDDPRRGVGVH